MADRVNPGTDVSVTGQPDEQHDVDPEDFLRALLKISPEDAAKARELAAQRDRERVDEADGAPRGQYGPTADYGEG